MLASKPLAKFCPTAYSTPTGMCHWHLRLITSGSEHNITVPPASPHLEMASSVFCAKPQELFLSLLVSIPSCMWSQILLIASSRHLLLLSCLTIFTVGLSIHVQMSSLGPFTEESRPSSQHKSNLISCALWWLLVFPDSDLTFPTSHCLTSTLAPIVSRLSAVDWVLSAPCLAHLSSSGRPPTGSLTVWSIPSSYWALQFLGIFSNFASYNLALPSAPF